MQSNDSAGNKPTDTTIALSLNGKSASLPVGTVLNDLVELLGLPPRGVAIALNGEIVPKSAWASTPLAEGAQVEVVSIAAGG